MNKIDWTLDHVAILTADVPNLTVPRLKEIASQVSGMTDRAAKDAKIRELALALPKTGEDAPPVDALAKTA